MKKKEYIIPQLTVVSSPIESYLCAGTTEVVGASKDNEPTHDAQSNAFLFYMEEEKLDDADE